MSRLGDLVRGHGLDGLIVLLALAAALELALRQDVEDAPETTLWFCIPVTALAVLTLLLRRRFPFGAPAAFWLSGAALSFADGELIPFAAGVYLAGMAAAFLLGNLRDVRLARIGLVVVVGSAAIIIYNLPDHAAGEFVFIPLLFAIAWLAGFALHTRAEQTEAAEARASQAERERELAARIAVAEERARIARELHDVVAHSVSVMVLRTGAVRHNLPDDRAADRDALRDVERAGRSALAEMRRLLGAMREGSADVQLTPQPGLGNLTPLLEEVRAAGLAVELQVEGEPFPLPTAIELSAYRIVQEGLTNALKHARAERADVLIRYGPEELRIDVRDDGRGTAPSDGLGHGLVGIRERVKLFGGEMTAGGANGKGFLLSTRLPLASVER